MKTTREWGEHFGILDPRVRKSVVKRKPLRTKEFQHHIDTMRVIVLDREEWYKSARASLGLPPTAKGLKGPEGVPCYGTFEAWESAVEDLQLVHDRLVAAGLSDIADKMPTYHINTMGPEVMFGKIALGRNHMETQQTYIPLVNRAREETVVATCTVGFVHCTTIQP